MASGLKALKDIWALIAVIILVSFLATVITGLAKTQISIDINSITLALSLYIIAVLLLLSAKILRIR
jgi:hypothetical protein